jgi:hypothetical protein
MLKKADIINAVNEIEGEDVDLQLLQDKLMLLQKLMKAEQDIKEGRVYTTDQLKETIDSWCQSSGQKLPKMI